MKFNPRARLDTSQVQDRRGSGGGGGFGGSGRGGGGGINIGRGGLAAGGGGLAILVLVAIFVFNSFSGGGGSPVTGVLGGGGSGNQSFDNSQIEQACQSGADAATNEDCVAVAVINSVQGFWADGFAQSGSTYSQADTIFYSGSTPTGCGQGSSGMGPFYCPADQQVYIDLSFWDELRTTFGANDAPFTQAYVIAHEYGHHVQDLLGTSERGGQATGATSGAVRLELQADCYAGAWANHASTIPGSDGEILITEITNADLQNALETAAAIGDDYIQTNLAGRSVDPSQFSHGTSAQRQKWFLQGYQSGNPASCNTFDTQDLG
jgi:uncharacterized protein